MSILSTVGQNATGNQFLNAPRSNQRNAATGARSTGGLTGGNVIPKGYKYGQLGQFTPEQQQLFHQLFSNVGQGSYLSRLAGGDQSLFGEIEAPALQQFGALQGNIASRFSGAGGLGGRHSSGFQNYLGQQSQDFAQQLQSQRQGLQRQALLDMGLLSESLLGQHPYDNFLIQKQQKQSGFGKALGIGLPVIGGVAGGIFGGPAGAAAGATLGSNLASGFTGSPQASYSGIGGLPTKWKF